MAQEIPNVNAMILQKLDEVLERLDRHEGVNKDQDTPTKDEYLTVSKTAEFLDCSEPHVYVLKKRVPCILRGARLYFKKSDLINYMEQGRTAPDKRMAHNRRKS